MYTYQLAFNSWAVMNMMKAGWPYAHYAWEKEPGILLKFCL